MFYFYLVWASDSHYLTVFPFFLFFLNTAFLSSLLYFHFVLNLLPWCKFFVYSLAPGAPISCVIYSVLLRCGDHLGVPGAQEWMAHPTRSSIPALAHLGCFPHTNVISEQRSCTGSQPKVSTTDPLPALPTAPPQCQNDAHCVFHSTCVRIWALGMCMP